MQFALSHESYARSFLHMMTYFWHYVVMLLAMTYNVGIFFAIVAGHFVGFLLFGRFSRLVKDSSCCN